MKLVYTFAFPIATNKRLWVVLTLARGYNKDKGC